MDYNQWFGEHLQASCDDFIWAIQRVSPKNLYLRPPNGLGDWCAARQVFHLMTYERDVALPAMELWLGKPIPERLLTMVWDDDAEWNKAEQKSSLEELIEDFRKVRQAQLAVLPQLPDSAWHESRDTLWGQVDLYWVLGKTWQHTAEHLSTVMRMALFWEMFEAEVGS